MRKDRARCAVAAPLVVVASLAVAAAQARAAEILVLSGGALKAPLAAAVPDFERTSGHTVKATFAPAGEIAKRVAAGETYDLLVLPAEALEPLEAQGRVVAGSRVPLGKVGIGVAVQERARAPDVSTTEALKQALLAARSLVYVDPERGTSGKHFASVLDRLGIAEAMRPKTTLLAGGYVVEPVGRGEVELGVAQITEILPVKGVKLAGPLPPPLQKWTVYTAAAMPGGRSPEAARALVAYLATGGAAAALRSSGVAPP